LFQLADVLAMVDESDVLIRRRLWLNEILRARDCVGEQALLRQLVFHRREDVVAQVEIIFVGINDSHESRSRFIVESRMQGDLTVLHLTFNIRLSTALFTPPSPISRDSLAGPHPSHAARPHDKPAIAAARLPGSGRAVRWSGAALPGGRRSLGLRGRLRLRGLQSSRRALSPP